MKDFETNLSALEPKYEGTLLAVQEATRNVTKNYPDEYYREMDAQKGFPHEFIRDAMAAGLGAIMVPEEYGGMGFGVREAAVCAEEINRSGGTASMIHGQLFMMGILSRHGSEDQKKNVVTKVADGSVRLQSFSVTEPDAGTDTSKIKTRARRGGKGWIVRGQKVWTSRMDHTDYFIVLARTSDAPEGKPFQGLSIFLVDKREVKPEQIKTKQIELIFNHHTYEVFYDDMEIPEDSLIGEEGKGFRYLLDGLNAERVLIASACIGDGLWFTEKAVRYANERIMFGRPIGQNQGVQFPIAKGYSHLMAASALRWQAAEKYDRNENAGAEANMAKMLASEAAWMLADDCMQTHGGFGMAREYDIERRFRETRRYRIAPISTNMVLNYVSQHVLGMPRSY